jgi:hypothetical protein
VEQEEGTAARLIEGQDVVVQSRVMRRDGRVWPRDSWLEALVQLPVHQRLAAS